MFAHYLASLKSGWGALIGFASAGPVALFAAELSPPWPSEGGGAAATLGTLATIIGVLLAYIDGAKGRSWRRRATISLCLVFLLALIYAACWSMTVVEVPQQVEGSNVLRRFVIGFAEHPEGLSPADAIAAYGPDDAYPRSSVLVGRLALLGSWLTMFLLLTFGFGLLQLAEARRKGRIP